MPFKNDKPQGLAGAVLLVVSLGCGAHAVAQTPSSPPSLPARTVGELLDIEAKMAAERAQEKLADFQARQRAKTPPPQATGGGVAGSATAPMAASRPQPPEDRIEVLAVLGIEGSKVTNLRINGELRVRQSVGATFGGYTIEQIGASCVVLRAAAKPSGSPVKQVAAGRSKSKVEAPSQPTLRRVCFSEYDAPPPAVVAGGAGGGVIPVITAPALPLPMVPPVGVAPSR